MVPMRSRERFRPATGHQPPATGLEPVVKIAAKQVSVYYGDTDALRNVCIDIYQNQVTALIGPSGCGKSTLLRCLNRMNDLIPDVRIEGRVGYHGADIYDSKVDPVSRRKKNG